MKFTAFVRIGLVFFGSWGAGRAEPEFFDDELAGKLTALENRPLVEWHLEAEKLAKTMPAARGQVWAEHLRNHPAVASKMVYPLVVKQWAYTSGPAAFAFARAELSAARPKLLSAAAQGWARQTPSEAWNALREVSADFNDLRIDISGAFSEIAEADLELGLALFQSLPGQRQCLTCLGSNLVVIAYRTGRLTQVKAFFETQPDSPHRSALRDMYWTFLGEEQPADRFDETLTVTPAEERGAAQSAFLRGMARRNLAAALDLAVSVGGDDGSAVAAVVNEWARFAESGDVGEIIAQLPESMSDRALAGVASTLARINPAAIADWSLAFRSESLRYQALAEVMSNWAWLDEIAARAFVEKQDDLELRGRLVWAYIFTRVRNHTFELGDLSLLEAPFNPDWRVNVLSTLAAALSNPKTQAETFLPTASFIAFIQDLDSLNEAQRQKILSPFSSP